MSARSFHRDGSLPEGGDWVFVFGSNLAGRHGAGCFVFRPSYIAKEDRA